MAAQVPNTGWSHRRSGGSAAPAGGLAIDVWQPRLAPRARPEPGAVTSPSDLGGPRRREAWMDVLRGLSITLILILHSTLVIELHGVEPWTPLVEFNRVFAPFRMPMLMFLSGLLLQQSMAKGWSRYYQGKLDKVVWPLLVWTVISHLVLTTDFYVRDPRQYLGPFHLWFMFFLAVYYAVAPLLQRFNMLLVVLSCLAISWLSPDGSKYLERLFCLMAFFFLGHYLGQRPELLKALTSRRVALMVLPVALALSAYAVLQEPSVVYGRPSLFLPMICGIAVLVAATRAISERGHTGPFSFLGRHSLIFYVSHYPVMYLIMGISLEAGLSLPQIALASLTAALAAGYGLTLASQRWGLVQALFERPRTAQANETA
jgi:surface polysaccharide O-acyltransferase-like enzyme